MRYLSCSHFVLLFGFPVSRLLYLRLLHFITPVCVMNPVYSFCTLFTSTCFKRALKNNNPYVVPFLYSVLYRKGRDWMNALRVFLNGTFLNANELIKLTSHKATVVQLNKMLTCLEFIGKCKWKDHYLEACRLFAPSLFTCQICPGRSGQKWVKMCLLRFSRKVAAEPNWLFYYG